MQGPRYKFVSLTAVTPPSDSIDPFILFALDESGRVWKYYDGIIESNSGWEPLVTLRFEERKS